jgi:uncharacterized protein YcfJ
MRASICLVATAAVALLAQSGPAPAKGCIKGAVVGGIAGHYSGHHTVLGAVTGCVAGRHLANRRKAAQTTGQAPTNSKPVDERGLSREDLANPP